MIVPSPILTLSPINTWFSITQLFDIIEFLPIVVNDPINEVSDILDDLSTTLKLLMPFLSELSLLNNSKIVVNDE